MTYILYLPFGLLPSIIWLFFYLKKDAHPESNKMIIKIFLYGMAAALMAAVVEIIIAMIITFPSPFIMFIFYHLIMIALVEEVAKFLIVRQKVIKDKEFDEPLDAMLYMVITALGFAALENLLYLSPLLLPSWFPAEAKLSLREAALVTGFRFIGATFLHALASGLVGYFLAYSICFRKKRRLLITTGIIIASVLHGLFNISIIILGVGAQSKNMTIIVMATGFLIIILSFLAVFVSFGFNKLKKIKSICQTNSSTN